MLVKILVKLISLEKIVKIEVKPIVLDLEMKEGSIKDIMTSSKHFGDNRSAYDESLRIVKT
jgi:hypothetical protein